MFRSWIMIKRKVSFFSIWVFFHEHSRFTGQQGKGESIYLTPLYHFHPLHRDLDISREITAESSPLHIDLWIISPGLYGINLRIQSEYWKIRTRNNSVFGHFSRSYNLIYNLIYSWCYWEGGVNVMIPTNALIKCSSSK